MTPLIHTPIFCIVVNAEHSVKNYIIVFFGLSGLPCDVMTRGEFRIRDYQLQNFSEQEIKANAVTQAKKLWAHFS